MHSFTSDDTYLLFGGARRGGAEQLNVSPWLSLHREEDDIEPESLHHPHTLSRDPRYATNNADVVSSPPGEGRLEDNSFLYDVVRPNEAQMKSLQDHVAALTAIPSSVTTSSNRATSSIEARLARRCDALMAERDDLKRQLDSAVRHLKALEQIVGGDVEAFHLQQVQLKEEIMRLHELLRNAQDQEQSARSRVKTLEQVLMQVELQQRRTDAGGKDTKDRSPASSLRERLIGLQDAIAKAYVQRTQLIDELSATRALGVSVAWRQEAIMSMQQGASNSAATAKETDDGGEVDVVEGSLSHWRVRGKEAQLTDLIAKKEQLISSLSAAAKEVEALIADGATLKASDGLPVENMAQVCPGCMRGQWSSPYCPMTGHQHAGYAQPSSDPSDRPQLKTVAEVLASGEWKKLVDVDNAKIIYEERGTGRRVEDLQQELERAVSIASAAAQEGQARTKQATANPSPSTSPAVYQGVQKEMRTLLDTLKERNSEIVKLKGLLRKMIESGGLAALPSQYLNDAAPLPAATPPLTVLPLSSAVSLEDQVARLSSTNESLNARCAELVGDITAKEETIDQQRKEIERLRFEGAPFSGEAQRVAEGEAEKARREALMERRRVAVLHDEVKRLRQLLPAT